MATTKWQVLIVQTTPLHVFNNNCLGSPQFVHAGSSIVSSASGVQPLIIGDAYREQHRFHRQDLTSHVIPNCVRRTWNVYVGRFKSFFHHFYCPSLRPVTSHSSSSALSLLISLPYNSIQSCIVAVASGSSKGSEHTGKEKVEYSRQQKVQLVEDMTTSKAYLHFCSASRCSATVCIL